MASVIVNDEHLIDIANAIREKNGEDITYKISEMANAIRNLSGGGSEEVITYLDVFIDETDNTSYMYQDNTDITGGIVRSGMEIFDCSYMFSGCSNLTTLNLSEFMVLEYETNMEQMFSGCSSLTSLAISDSMCARIDEYFYSGETELIAGIFNGMPINSQNGDEGYLYVPEERLWQYQNARDWSDNYNLKSINEWTE